MEGTHATDRTPDGARAGAEASALRRALDGLYLLSGVLAAGALLAIVALILAQVGSRLFSIPFRGGSDYAGYAMAAASFFGFSYALQHGAHIRVGLLLAALGRHRFWGEVWGYGLGTLLTAHFAWQACLFTYESWEFKDVSSGLDATPLWIPQLAMAIGSVVFAIAFLDNFVTLLRTGRPLVRETGLRDEAFGE